MFDPTAAVVFMAPELMQKAKGAESTPGVNESTPEVTSGAAVDIYSFAVLLREVSSR